jgi:hypothetical protein
MATFTAAGDEFHAVPDGRQVRLHTPIGPLLMWSPLAVTLPNIVQEVLARRIATVFNEAFDDPGLRRKIMQGCKAIAQEFDLLAIAPPTSDPKSNVITGPFGERPKK